MTTHEGARQPQTLHVDPERSRFGFKAKAFLLMPVSGTLRARGGTVTTDGRTLSATGVAESASVSTRLKPRDWHLRHKHYLWAEEHPDVTLEVVDMPVDARSVEAKLTARGKTIDVELQIDALDLTDRALRLKATGAFDRTPLGMLPPPAGVSRRIRLDLDLVAAS